MIIALMQKRGKIMLRIVFKDRKGKKEEEFANMVVFKKSGISYSALTETNDYEQHFLLYEEIVYIDEVKTVDWH